MFDIATRLQPASLGTPALTVPFDWRLAQPAPAQGYSFTTVLATALFISQFTDRRAGGDGVLAPGNAERRGWVGKEFFSTTGEDWSCATAARCLRTSNSNLSIKLTGELPGR